MHTPTYNRVISSLHASIEQPLMKFQHEHIVQSARSNLPFNFPSTSLQPYPKHRSPKAFLAISRSVSLGLFQVRDFDACISVASKAPRLERRKWRRRRVEKSRGWVKEINPRFSGGGKSRLSPGISDRRDG